MPAIVEADDSSTYVVKFRGAAQGVRALIAEGIPLIAAGDPAGGPIAVLPRGERFHWLVAPRSAVIQTSPVHTGLCDDPQAALDDLVRRLVAT